jgi:guanosine-3',5'-bis(diphosphate) 3'-pyrophosphohydrolase
MVADLVDGVTKLTQIEEAGKNETQAQNFRKMVLAMSKDIRVILIKLADRLHNMQTVSSLKSHKRFRVAKETLDIYAPIANRLGMYKMYVELEDLAFAALYPRRFAVLKKSVDQVYGKYKEMASMIAKELQETFAKTTLKNIEILGRTKHLYGIYRKMLNHRASFSSIMDVYAFRVITESVEDCYRALGIIHNLYKPLPGRFKDYIAIPKFNGYQSLHTVLFGPYGAPVEVQIRTKLMNQMANNGIAAHWLYKENDDTVNATHMRTQQWVNRLLEMQQNAHSSSEFFENVKIDLFPDKVYVFTPKGNIMELTRGATAVDFAYAVHTDIGNSCVAARINRKFLPLSTVLLHGQTVSIITSPKTKPNPAWLSFIATSKARHSIRQYLKNKKRDELVGLGKQLLNKAFVDMSFDSQKISEDIFKSLLKKSGFKNEDDLYESIGLGNDLANLLACQLINMSGASHDVVAKSSNDQPLLICGTEGVAITFAECCYPIPGDSIIGSFGSNCGLEIHKTDCTNLTNVCNKAGKCMPVKWAENITNNFRVVLGVEVVDKAGALAEITQELLKANADIDDIKVGGRSGKYVLLSFCLLVRNISHLERIKRYVSSVSDVISVVRKKCDTKSEF